MRIKWYLSDLHACGPVRGEALARAVNKHTPHHIDCKSEIFKSDFYGTDVMVFQRQRTHEALHAIQYAKEHGIKTVYELDDDLFHVTPEVGGACKYFNKPLVQTLIQACLNLVDAVSVATVPLAKEVQKRTDAPVFVLPNALVLDDWLRESPKKDHLTIGWMASNTHDADALLVDLPLAQVLEENPEIRLTLLGSSQAARVPTLSQYSGQITTIGWQKMEELPDYMSYFDIGIAPVTRTPFSDAKSGIKALQYWASSTPIVCSQSPCYELVHEGIDGFLADSADEWFNCLKELIEQPGLRKKMGDAGQWKLKGAYAMENMADCWLDLFHELVA